MKTVNKKNWIQRVVAVPKRYIYVVGVFNHPLHVRMMGLYDSEEEVNKAVKNNTDDIHESFYDWAIVERFPKGIKSNCFPHDAMWYRWDNRQQKYVRKSRPPSLVGKLGLMNLTLTR